MRKRPLLKKLADTFAEETAAHPDVLVDIYAADEHRIGLKPVMRSAGAPAGQRPVALGHHRFKWLYVITFVAPATGDTEWYLSNGVSKPFFEKLLLAFANDVGAGSNKRVILLLDNAGWHTLPNLAVPDGSRLVYLPPYSPKLQPAETLWTLVDEPVVNRHIASIAELETIVAKRCLDLIDQKQAIQVRAAFHWWPAKIKTS